MFRLLTRLTRVQADADSIEAMRATLLGTKKRFAETGKPVSYIETVGDYVRVYGD